MLNTIALQIKTGHQERSWFFKFTAMKHMPAISVMNSGNPPRREMLRPCFLRC